MAIVKRFPRLQIPGWKAHPHLIPQIGSIYDDEFDAPDGVINSAWTVSTDTSLSYDVNRTIPHHLWTKLDGQADSRLVIYKTISEASTFSYTAHLLMPSGKLTNTVFYFRISSADALYQISAEIRTTATTGQYIYFNNYNNGTWGTATSFQTNAWKDEWYIQLQYEGSNVWRAWWSFDGLGWTSLATKTQAITIARLYTHFVNTATTYDGDLWMASDFIRRNWRHQQ